MTNPPLQRHASLKPFSRDHYNGLVQARHLVLAADSEPVARRSALRDFIQCWSKEIADHFADEERLLLRLIPDDGDADRLRQEHATLRTLAAEASVRQFDEDIDAEWVRLLGKTLNDHIRWEERHLFPAIERTAAQPALQELERETSMIESNRDRTSACARRIYNQHTD